MKVKLFGKEITVHRVAENGPNPYSDNPDDRIDTWVTDGDYEIWIKGGFNPKRYEELAPFVIQYGPGPDWEPDSEKAEERKSVAELRAIADDAAALVVPEWNERKKGLHPLEDNRAKKTYFFRWDDFAVPIKDSGLPPFLQVAVRSDGKIMSFTNTLKVRQEDVLKKGVHCPHCGDDLAKVGVRAYYEAYDDVDLEGYVTAKGDNTWEELLDAECGSCRGNVRKVVEKLPDFPAFNRINYAKGS